MLRAGYVAIWKDPIFLPRLVHLRVSRIVLRRVASRCLASRRSETTLLIVKERSTVRDFVNETEPSLVPCARRINWAFNYAVSCMRPAERRRDVYARVCPSRLAFWVPLTTTRATGDTPR